MFQRFLKVMAVTTIALSAQIADAQGFKPRGKPAFVPSKRAAATEVVQTAGETIQPAQAVAPAMQLPPASQPLTTAAPAQPAASAPVPQWMADVNMASQGGFGGYDACNICGEATDCLCGPPGRLWFGAEWLYWTTRGNNLPPIATTAPAGTPRAVGGVPVAGVLGAPTTSTLIGGRDYNNDWRSGLRIYGGLWLNDAQTWGLEGNFFFLGNSRNRATVGSDGSQIITRPFTNNVVRQGNTFVPGTPFQDAQLVSFQDTQLVSFPGQLRGSVSLDSSTELIGGGANLVRNLLCNECGRLDFLAGYRYMNLTDDTIITENLTAINPNAGTTFDITDRFRVENHFHGGVIGLNWERRFSHWFIGMRSSVALGVNHAIVDISGNTVITPAGGTPTTFAGGLLTQPSNIGRYTRDSFAVIPEVGLRLGAQVTPHMRVFAGYNFLYWSDVVRSGDVIDLRVNASQIAPRNLAQAGQPFPVFSPSSSDFFAHGVMIGMEFRY